MNLDDATRSRINSFIESHDVALFMKGDRGAPQCGFSQTVVGILDSLIPDYQTLDVLSDPEIRAGIKEFSSWPTVPQLYVKGEFIGGCDIVQELFSSGELHQTLGVNTDPPGTPPALEISEAAAEALRNAALRSGFEDRVIHLGVDARGQTSLYFAPAQQGAVAVESQGVRVHLDALSARRADGVRIDVVDTPQGPGFQIHVPSAPRPSA